MILSLLIQEFQSSSSFRGRRQVLAISLKIFASLIFMALLGYLFWEIDIKIRELSTLGTFDFLVLYLFLAMMISSLSALPSSLKALERKEDHLILSPLPISDDQKILAKGLYFYVKLVVSSFVLSLPILLSFGIARGYSAIYYTFTFLYPVFISLFSLGLLSLLLGPFSFFMKIMRRYRILQFVIASIAVVSLCFFYQQILSLFLSILDGAKLDSYFSEPFLKGLAASAPYFVPVYPLLGMMCGVGNYASNLLLYAGLVLLMLVVGFFLLSFLLKRRNKRKETPPSGRLTFMGEKHHSVFFSLVKKEFVLLFRNSSYLFSFTSLLIMQPFLGYVVIESLNQLLYDKMEMFLVYFPELINGVTIVLVLLFASLISGSAADGLTREGVGRIVMKEIPVAPIKQMEAKLLVSVTVSFLSLLLTDIVLASFSLISVGIFFEILALGTLFILSLNILGAFDDFRRLSEKRNGGTSLLALYSLLMPILYALFHFGMVFLKVPGYAIYLMMFFLYFAFFLTLFFLFFKKCPKYFKTMRVDYV